MDLLVHLDRLNYTKLGSASTIRRGFEIIACPEMFIAAGRGAHAPYPARHRRRFAALPQPVHRRGPHDAARLHDARPRHVRRRAGSLVYDADKMGLKAADQRRKLDESLDVIVELMQGRMVTQKTDWFDLSEARLQLRAIRSP